MFNLRSRFLFAATCFTVSTDYLPARKAGCVDGNLVQINRFVYLQFKSAKIFPHLNTTTLLGLIGQFELAVNSNYAASS